MVGVGQDITELNMVAVEAKLRADNLTRLIDTANAPFFGVDLQCNVTEWNRKAAELSGFASKETMRQPLVDNFITPDWGVLEDACRGKEMASIQFHW